MRRENKKGKKKKQALQVQKIYILKLFVVKFRYKLSYTHKYTHTQIHRETHTHEGNLHFCRRGREENEQKRWLF